MTEKKTRFLVSREKIKQQALRVLESARKELEEYRSALKVFEGAVRGKERDLKNLEEFIKQIETGKLKVPVAVAPEPEEFAGKSIADAAFEAIEEVGRPMHVKELLEMLEAGGKRIKASRPTVSIAASLSRDPRFRRVGRNVFDVVARTQPELPLKE